MIAAPNFNLTIVYESVEEGKRAKRFCDQFIAEAAIERPFELNLWNFGVLGIPEIRNTAASTAAIADPRGYLFQWEAEPRDFDRMILNRLHHRLSRLRLNGFTHVH